MAQWAAARCAASRLFCWALDGSRCLVSSSAASLAWFFLSLPLQSIDEALFQTVFEAHVLHGEYVEVRPNSSAAAAPAAIKRVTFNEIHSEHDWWSWVRGPLRAAIGTGNPTARCPASRPHRRIPGNSSADGGVVCTAIDPDETTAKVSRNNSCILQVGTTWQNNESYYSSQFGELGTMCEGAVGRHVLRRYNLLVGSPQLQQYRVKADNSECLEPFKPPKELKVYPKGCYSPFDSSISPFMRGDGPFRVAVRCSLSPRRRGG